MLQVTLWLLVKIMHWKINTPNEMGSDSEKQNEK